MRRPTRHKAETLRVGEMIFFPSLECPRFVKSVQVGSDRLPGINEPGTEPAQIPRWLARAFIANGAPAYRTRRAAQRECNRMNCRVPW